MYERDYRDLAGGALLMGIGIFVALYAWVNYPLGTMQRMGPGMFPLGMGLTLSAFGLLILVPAIGRPAELPSVDLPPFLAILLGATLFAVSIERLGLVPAVLLLTATATLAVRKLGPVGVVVLCAALAAIAVVLFVVGLGLPIRLFRWPA